MAIRAPDGANKEYSIGSDKKFIAWLQIPFTPIMKSCTKFQFFTIFAHTRRIGAAAQKSEASPQQNSGPVLNFLDFFATTPEDNFQMHCSY